MLQPALDGHVPESVLPAEAVRPAAKASASLARPRLRSADGPDVAVEDWDRAVELLRVAFNGGPNWFNAGVEPRAHITWKLVDYPGPTRAYFSEDQTSEDDESLVGFVATLGRDWLVRGRHRVATDMVDAALHPRLQGRVLVDTFRFLRREVPAWNGADFSLSFASHPALIRNRGFQGKHDLGQSLETHIRPLDLVRFVRGDRLPTAEGASRTRLQIEAERRRRRKPAAARLLAWQLRLMRQRLDRAPLDAAPQSSYAVTTADRFDGRVDALFERAAEAFDLVQVRHSDFLNWRYLDERAGQFTVRVAESGGEMLGYAVLNTARATADLADLLVLPGRLDVARSLVGDAMHLARQSGSSAVRSWMMRGHPYEPVLSHLGFVRVRTSTRPVLHANARTIPDELAVLESPQVRVHLMLGDSDHV
ncbi:MAG: hypothetical protein AB7F65_00155 [Dehalococcoidia bacterium]